MLEAQQLAVPLGPQVAANPTQDGWMSQTFVVGLQIGLRSLQSAFDRHSTHFDDVPMSLHFGAEAAQLVQPVPQLESTLHTEQTPAAPHRLLLPQLTPRQGSTVHS
jgi:hypothetical protein